MLIFGDGTCRYRGVIYGTLREALSALMAPAKNKKTAPDGANIEDGRPGGQQSSTPSV